MKVFVAGASGALGRPLVRTLVADGHDVVGMMARPGGEEACTRPRRRARDRRRARSRGGPAGRVRGRARGRHPRDDRPAAGSRATGTSIAAFELTNRLRTTGLDNLLDAANAVGARRFIAQSFGNWNYAREGGPVKTEEDRLDPDPPRRWPGRSARSAISSVRFSAATAREGVVLRYANLYGPGASMGKGGGLLEQVRSSQGADRR